MNIKEVKEISKNKLNREGLIKSYDDILKNRNLPLLKKKKGCDYCQGDLSLCVNILNTYYFCSEKCANNHLEELTLIANKINWPYVSLKALLCLISILLCWLFFPIIILVGMFKDKLSYIDLSTQSIREIMEVLCGCL